MPDVELSAGTIGYDDMGGPWLVGTRAAQDEMVPGRVAQGSWLEREPMAFPGEGD